MVMKRTCFRATAAVIQDGRYSDRIFPPTLLSLVDDERIPRSDATAYMLATNIWYRSFAYLPKHWQEVLMWRCDIYMSFVPASRGDEVLRLGVSRLQEAILASSRMSRNDFELPDSMRAASTAMLVKSSLE
ncbi:hypothetical protein TNCV_3238241 [Trichonephila clavipes]|nr:hypothetical protein TNCV_3238241 [Trichonephila clavipes]